VLLLADTDGYEESDRSLLRIPFEKKSKVTSVFEEDFKCARGVEMFTAACGNTVSDHRVKAAGAL
jgi:hypothetical protein